MAITLYRISNRAFTPNNLVLNQIRCLSKFYVYGCSPIPFKKQRFVPLSGTYPKGFLIGSINVGIKPTSISQPDLVLAASEKEYASCGCAVFTKNEFPAASITVSRDLVRKTKGYGLRGVIANSWCANLLTGQTGLDDSLAMSKAADEFVAPESTDEKRESSVMVMHTGAGGQRLPIDDIIQNIPTLYQSISNSHDHWLSAAKGICTTDTFPKLASRTFTLPSSPNTKFSIAGITKGAGMIHPNMATTLGIICTDVSVTPIALQQLLGNAASNSYNCISIEGDTSTNDMVAILANGAAGGPEIDFSASAKIQSDDFLAFQKILAEFMADLAKLVVRDGEGATKFITIRIRNSPSYPAAKHIASVVARSVLVKTGIYGKDANWGTILSALGYSLIDSEFAGKNIIIPELTSVSFVDRDENDVDESRREEELKFLEKGRPVCVDERKVKKMMEREDVEVVVDLRDDGMKGERGEEAVYWTCDLTHDFVTVNGDFGNEDLLWSN